MGGLQVTIGATQANPWIATLGAGVVSSLIGLGGITLGAYLNARATTSQRAEDERRRQAERKEAADAQRQVAKHHRALAALALAEHLESFVVQCTNVIDSFWHVDWDGLRWFSPSGDGPLYLQVLPAWPELVDWKLLDLQLAVDASNFKRRTELTRAGLDASGENGEDDHCLHADRAAVLAVTAWEMAKRTRRENDLDPLDVTHTWEIVEPAQAHIEKRAKIEALRRGEIQSLADPLPVDSDAPNEP